MAIFVKYDGITGQVNDSEHKGWMRVHELAWEAGREITSNTSTRGDRESSNARIGDLVMTRLMDKATPKIFLEACCGKGKDVEIHLTKSGKGSGAEIYMAYVLKNCLISHYAMSCTPKHKNRPTERITISFTELEVKYTPYDDEGMAQGPLVVGFDTKTNMRA
ncbi:MAG: type VI secretion system tube protein Hcp [Thiotrichales bacterium]|nr:type VI secretion system tube protein Hcp [Thiotrichales bacterium]PCH62567.1 MAG: hypothetical protein COC09_08025 [Gammaproteobacteria bacterium]